MSKPESCQKVGGVFFKEQFYRAQNLVKNFAVKGQTKVQNVGLEKAILKEVFFARLDKIYTFVRLSKPFSNKIVVRWFVISYKSFTKTNRRSYKEFHIS